MSNVFQFHRNLTNWTENEFPFKPQSFDLCPTPAQPSSEAGFAINPFNKTLTKERTQYELSTQPKIYEHKQTAAP